MRKPLDLRGIFPALATPFRDDRSLDEERLRDLIRYLLDDVDGFVVNGTTGDFPLLSFAERRRTIEIAVEETAGMDKIIIAGTGAIATEEVVTLTLSARDAGADAALVIAPYYLRPTPAGMRQHFATIAAAAPHLPLLLYNFPQLVGQAIPVDVIESLHSEVSNVIGMKDTSGDLPYMLTVLERLPDTFQVLVGRGTAVLPALASGATGAVLACANLIPDRWQRVLHAVATGDLETAQREQLRAQQVSRVVGKAGSLAVRAGLEILGRPIGPPRGPLTFEGALTSEDREALLRALEV
ncbi:MAG: dihydrodipicolinate synthase family protein [Anaerolineae bacterium]